MTKAAIQWNLNNDVDLDNALCLFETANDPETARQLARHFHERLKNADVVSIDEPLLIRYFRIVMGRMIEGAMKPEQAMGFALQKGKYAREDTESRDMAYAAYVVLERRKGKTKEAAVGEAANLFDADSGDRAAERAYQKYRGTFESFPDAVLHNLFS